MDRVQRDPHQRRLDQLLAGEGSVEVGRVESPLVRERMVALVDLVDRDLAVQVAEGVATLARLFPVLKNARVLAEAPAAFDAGAVEPVAGAALEREHRISGRGGSRLHGGRHGGGDDRSLRGDGGHGRRAARAGPGAAFAHAEWRSFDTGSTLPDVDRTRMPTPAEKKALIFLAAVAVAGATVHATHIIVSFAGVSVAEGADVPPTTVEVWQSPDVPIGTVSSHARYLGVDRSTALIAFGRGDYRSLITTSLDELRAQAAGG